MQNEKCKMKVLVIYYSQTGQVKQIVDSIVSPLGETHTVTFAELRPVPPFPFPWNGMPFFQVFPESVKEIPCELEPLPVNPDDDFDLVILAYQVWYLSPSIPVTSFLMSEAGKSILKGKPVITVLGVRNMWIMAQERVKKMIADAGGRLAGNIVMTDPAPNLTSVITIVRWMMKGKNSPFSKFGIRFPQAGVPKKDIREAGRFGHLITEHLQAGSMETLQAALSKAGAVPVDPVLFNIEKRGKMMFGLWAKIILEKGAYNDPRREFRLRLFKYYLFAVIYLVSPFVSALFRLIFMLNRKAARKIELKYSTGMESL